MFGNGRKYKTGPLANEMTKGKIKIIISKSLSSRHVKGAVGKLSEILCVDVPGFFGKLSLRVR